MPTKPSAIFYNNKRGGIKVKHDAPYRKFNWDTQKGDSTSGLRYPEFEMGRQWDFSVFYPEPDTTVSSLTLDQDPWSWGDGMASPPFFPTGPTV